ncbi:5'-nucleotidase [Termitidicoccus mucosus]|uniref:5'-nucleotidase n=1 Tax=Termitidicoccus mucosus TaxID=1184151 RepID=UPI0008398BBA
MPFDLDNVLVVAISSSALFDAREEDRIFREQGQRAFIDYQIANEDRPFKKGTAFPLIEGLLRLNTLSKKQLVEVVVLSHNNPEAGLRAMNSVEHYGLELSRAAFVGSTPVARYLPPYRVKLFLSRNEADVRQALAGRVAAGLIYDPPTQLCAESNQLRIAFDGDAVIFSDESERVYQQTKNLQAFFEHEQANAQKPMADGPFAAFLRWIAQVQADASIRNSDDSSPIRTALVTARNGPAVKRVILTLRAWGVAIDEEFFLGGINKAEILQAFNPHIFFDDQDVHAAPASRLVSTARVMCGPTADIAPPAPVVVPAAEVTPPSAHYEEVTKVPDLAPVGALTKKVFETRLREIFLGYTPLNNGVLDPRYRKFIADNRDRPGTARAAILRELERYDLSGMTSHKPMLNREREDMVAAKLARVVAKAADSAQGKLDLK